MKKLLGFVALGLAGTVAAIAATTTVADLNAEIARLLAPFQNETTKAELVFRSVETDAVRALHLDASGRYFKVGTQNQLDLNVEELSYNYGDGTAPTTKLKASLGIDLSKLMPQEQLNQLVPGAEQMVQSMAKDLTREYGDAVALVVQITDKTQDQQGNYTGIKAKISGKVDLTKLPATKPVDSVIATEAELYLTVDVKAGFHAELTVVSNPAYKAFQNGQEGLKDYLDKLLNRDEATLGELVRLFKQLDSGAADFVNGPKR